MREKNTNQEKLITAIMEFLGCPCEYYPPMADSARLMEIYQEAKKRGEKEGFTPVIITVDDILWECISMNTEAGDGTLDFDPKAAVQYRKEILNTPIENGKELLEAYSNERDEDYSDEQEEDIRSYLSEEEYALYLKEQKEEYGDGESDWEDADEEMAEDQKMDHFVGYLSYNTKGTVPVILAEIPVKNPWEIFAFLPFGGWNECPDTMDLMAVAKYWYELYGAMPAVITHDTLEFSVPAPVKKEQASQLAAEQYSFCPDIVDQASEGFSVGLLAKMLEKSNTWYFWWD